MSEEEVTDNSVSRRIMLRRIGAAGAVAWVAPVISSVNTPAFAGSPPVVKTKRGAAARPT